MGLCDTLTDHAQTWRQPVSEWTVRGTRTVYTSPWVELDLVDVEPPGQKRYEHHLIKLAPVAATVLLDDADRVLLMWRHRFATDTWNWEIPSGIVEAGEDLASAAAREVLEETGYQVDPGTLTELAYNQPIGGMSNAEHTVFLARDAVRVAEPVDTHEADRIEWHPVGRVQQMIDDRKIVAGVAVTGLLQLLARR
jgi:8-oxo-dGTP pyrophosphatase MutT (NUDIX family)